MAQSYMFVRLGKDQSGSVPDMLLLLRILCSSHHELNANK